MKKNNTKFNLVEFDQIREEDVEFLKEKGYIKIVIIMKICKKKF